ncbi:mucin-2 [Rhinolophus ferrumequinum]|uniref:mucin-2 n=1 Tax=Rhinolophus ferrumequinum TaxID=59479 RepID=UPI00140FA53F|nr:mucin-2 [Rhinolophus ferrumequinum]
MGLPLACLVALCLALTPARSVELRREGRTRNHGHNVCSTWGDFHYKTFDGDVYRFPGLCDYNLASDCRSSYKEFAVHVKRSPGRGGGHPQFQHILLMIKDDTIYLTHQLVVVNGAIVTTPHYSSGLLIEKNDAYTKVFSRAGLSLIWNREDSLMLELDSKFRNHTCGLCGDYNGLQNYSEFLSDGVLFSAIEFGNMQKIIKPEEVCDDPEDVPAPKSCSEHRAECEELLTAMAFEECLGLVPLEPYVQTCMQDRCQCPPGASCMCSTIAEFSRQCSHAGGRPGNWRTATLCPKSCPGNMVYMESGSPCMDTCSHLEISSLCEEHRMDGCFCPEGTVYDDMAGKGCIPVSQCHCKLHGHLYAPGQKVTNNCEHCVCNAGRWVCKDLPCPGTCALEGGSHITTFDGKKYTFHGDCYYVLTKDEHNDSYALLGELAPCGSTDKQTCLKTVVLLADKKKNVVAFKSDGSVLLNELQVNLPHVTASFSIFQPSSYHLVVSTTFGLRLQVQLVPVMQLFLTLDQASQGRVQGLCGNFNGQESDDFKTAGGLVEATGAGFANTWKAQSNCHDKLDWLDDPCSLNIESANYAEHWCSLLKKTESPFGRCHSAVDPAEYYKRCRYDTCNCQNNEDCMCAALSSYARACATKGVMLWGWRELVCNKDVGSCPKSQVFLYNLTTCQQTCRSLSEPDSHCLKGFAPVDGCGCPDHTFLDEKGRCVPLAKCSCYHRGLYLEAGEVVLKQEERCVCRNGRLHCTQVKLLGQSCAAPKIHVDCNNLTALSIRNPRPVSCQTLAAGYYHTECISGCVCPEGQMDDGRGGCVVEKECPCMHNKHLYNPGDKIKVDCNTCTCQKGRWACTQTGCHGTCTIYGSGHYITFDGKQYDFDGHCSYVATQDYCGQNSSLGSFSIITENVPCGTTGVTCSKAIKIFIGRTELKLEDKHRMVIQRDVGHRVGYTTRDVGQYLVVETSTGIIVIWDKRTTIFIKLAPSYKGSVCGLCGNFDQRSNNDFTTRDNMVVESELDFGNSWKEAPTCPDVTTTPEPCVKNPHRQAWAEKQCSIIKSPVFSICHSKVDPKPFYEACVHDSCSCDTGGDCECFCSAVAAYAQECTKEEACVYWRTPDLCPVFCDYYNPPDECEWHYEPCGNRSFETCRTINGIHSNISVSYLEGCYPRCPADRPIYNEDLKKCVTSNECGCYHEGILYPPGASVPPRNECESCVCINSSLTLCQPEEGKILNYTQDGSFCYWEICGPNATVEKHFNICMSTLPPFSSPTPTTTTTTCTTTPTTTTPTPSTVSSVPSTTPELCCFWSDWINNDDPNTGNNAGDKETFDSVCQAPEDIQCRSAKEPGLSLEELGQKVQCNVSFGFICKNEDQFGNGPFDHCYDYEIRVKCCLPMDQCPSSPASTPTPTTVRTTPEPTTITTETPTPTPVITTTTTVTPTTTPTIITETSTPTPPPTTTVTATSTTSPTSTPEPTTTVTTTTTTSTTTPVTPTTVTTEPTTTQCADDCKWTGWLDSGKPSFTKPGGDFESIKNVCEPGWAANISCRASQFPNIPIENLGQTVVCDLSVGLVCKNQDQKPGGVVPQPYCLNYEINVYCCNRYCASTPTPTTTTTTETPTTTVTPTTTPIITSSETPTPTPITTTTTTTTETPTPTPTIVTETPTPTPITTTTTTTTETPTPTPTIITETPTPTPTISVTPPPTPTTTISTETPIPTSTTPVHETTTPESSTPSTSQSTVPSSTESSTLLTTIPTIVETSSMPSPTTETKPTVTTTGGTTPAPPPTPGTQTSGPTTLKTTPTSGTTTGPPSPTTRPPSTPTPTPLTASTTTTGTPTPTGSSSATPPLPSTPQTFSTSVPIPTTSPIATPSTGENMVTSPIITCCVLNDTHYIPGDVVYNGTHGETCYYVNCSLSCQLEFFNWSCPSTPSPTPTPSKPTPSSTPSPSTPTTRPSTASSTPTSTKPPGCPNFDPPRQENETWWLCNCTMAVCKHNNTVELVEVECNPPPMPTCSNNLTPVRVMDPDGCCWHWECDCYCTGWGDPHYVTFDGLYYSYQGNCTYVLVEQIDPKVDNFGVYIDNYHCDINDQVSCPRTLIVRHETQEVLVKTVHMAPMKVQVQVNKQAVALPYKKYGLQVYESGINYVVDIPELGAVISYNGLSFSIRLPYRLFGNNTKGQCGTCTNSTEDDCVLPSGEVVSNCEVAADEWVVNDPSKPHCPHTTFTTRRPATTPSGGSGHTPNKDCASPLCELIKDSLFAQCHSLAPPEHYYEACRFDSCFVPNSGMECVSLQTYAALCAQEGVCVDWRNHTHGVCSMSCPSHKEYQACGPAEEPTCKSSSSQNNTVLVEGCFCPEGTMSYAPGFDVCVKSCGCVGPDNVPREFGEHFEFDCKDCVCLEGGSGIVCEPKKCTQNSPKCTEDGTYPVTEVDPANTCCNITTCKCNTSLCKEKAPLCALGFDVKSEMVPGRCCPVYSCVPKGVCVLENAEYQPGSPVYSSKCQHCVCTNTTDSATQLNLVSCSHVPCNTTCDIGFELVDAPGECCRKCEQTHCIINRPDNQHFILKPGDMKSDPKNNCTFFSCVKIHNQLISSVSNITCPDFDPTTCLPGSITLMPNGCCKKCIPRNETRIPCSTIPMTKIVTDAGCTGKITTNYCSGSCGTFAMYSAEAQALDHKCSCCKEQRTSRRQVVLSCPDGSSRSHTYTHIESCLCQDTVCEIPLAQRRVPSRGRRSSSQVLRPGTA